MPDPLILSALDLDTSMLFTKLARSLCTKRPSARVSLPKFLGFPAAQTSLSTSPHISQPFASNLISFVTVVSLPDELILSILSHISPEPPRSDHFTRFRVQYGLRINRCHWERMRFLRALSMTCKAMRLRLVPWIWERLEVFPRESSDWLAAQVQRLKSVLSALKGDACLAISVR